RPYVQPTPRRAARPTRLPYTTLFRSVCRGPEVQFVDTGPGESAAHVFVFGACGSRELGFEDADCLAGGGVEVGAAVGVDPGFVGDRKSTRLNCSHVSNSYAVFCLNKI